MQKRVLMCFASVGIDEVGDLLKREKRDCQRQDNSLNSKAEPCQGIYIFNEKIGVLVVAQQ